MSSSQSPSNLSRFAWLSIGAAILTIALKMGAYLLTNSVSLLSDALESLVNLVTAIAALAALNVAARPADEEFAHGYSKIEFFSGGFEGAMILVAAGSIVATAIPRLIHPEPLEQVGLGLIVSAAASLINLWVSRILSATGKRSGSVALQADANHLMTDVITTAGVLAGVVLVSLTGWMWLDPVIAILVAINILRMGYRLIRQSVQGLLDVSLPAEDLEIIQNVLKDFEKEGVQFHAVRTRSAGSRSFVSMHILVPGQWHIRRGHSLAEEVEMRIRARLQRIVVFTHVEPVEDPAAWEDRELERT